MRGGIFQSSDIFHSSILRHFDFTNSRKIMPRSLDRCKFIFPETVYRNIEHHQNYDLPKLSNLLWDTLYSIIAIDKLRFALLCLCLGPRGSSENLIKANIQSNPKHPILDFTAISNCIPNLVTNL